VRLKLYETHEVLVHVDIVKLLEDNIDTVTKDTETLIDTGKKIGLEVNAGTSKYVVTCSTVALQRSREGTCAALSRLHNHVSAETYRFYR
jgi:hypothetical protein